MRKEGTGRPRDPDIAIHADVKARELYFEEVPDTDVRFRGNTSRNSVWGSKRKNLPDEVQEGVVYRDAGVQLCIASEVADGYPELLNGLDRERVYTDSEHRIRKTRVGKEAESKEETE